MRIRHLARCALHGEIKSYAASLLMTVLAASTLGAQSPNPITIRAVDYAFQSPDTISAGPTLFTFENHGTVRHEVVISRLKEGHTFAEVMAAKTPAERNAALDGFIGILLSEAGKTPQGQLLVPIEKGASYVLFCTLRDSPEKPQHIAQGMARLLYAR